MSWNLESHGSRSAVESLGAPGSVKKEERRGEKSETEERSTPRETKRNKKR